MTRLERRNHGRSHSYTLDGQHVPGVTTIIGILDKPALVGWAAKETAAYADENWDVLSEMRSADRIEQMTKARFQTNRRAIVQGNRVHALGERIAKGEQIDPKDVEPHLRSWADSYAKFLDAWDMEVLHTEMPIAHTDYHYAGTLDAIVRSPRLGTILLDLKTGKGVYEEVGLQLAAYRYADLGLVAEEITGPRGGKKTQWNETALPQIDGAYVAHLHEDSVEFHPVKAGEETWTSFLYMREIYDMWVRRVEWKNRNEPYALQVIGEAIYPEDRPVLEGAQA